MRKVVLRTPEEKADATLWWSRSDEDFFAAGACHVLAAVFLATYPSAEFGAWIIRPRAPHSRAVHVVAARDDLVFDSTGYSEREAFLAEYIDALRRGHRDWACDFVAIDTDPIGWDFCRSSNHRHPSQFPSDPIPRAQAFLSSFASPLDLIPLILR